MSDDNFIKSIDCTLGIAKWFILQVFLYFLMPYLWNYEYGEGQSKSVSISYVCREHDAIESVKEDILERRNKRHYLLADVALVGEAIMLAMRTNVK